jgi:DNA-binding NtrC family response regulator
MNESVDKLRIIIIDDEEDWGSMLKTVAESLGHSADYVKKLQDAQDKIKIADERKEPYSIATIDRNFKTGEKGIEVARGIEVLNFIKSNYKYIACIMVSGHTVLPDEVLDLRDKYDLDYYLQKDRVEIGSFKKAIERAVQRIRPKDSKERLRLLKDSLDKWLGIHDEFFKNLSHYTLISAKKGMDVDVMTINGISQCKSGIEEAENYIKSIKEEIEGLEVDKNLTN